jgi:hypothetical protein
MRHEDIFPEDNASPDEEVVPLTESDPVTDEHTKNKTEEQALSHPVLKN